MTVEIPRASHLIPRGHETILVVDDEPMVLGLTRHLLQRHGYRVLEAVDGASALEVWEDHQHEIKLLLTDIHLSPCQSGVELAEMLRQRNPALRIIITSGMVSEDEERVLSVLPESTFVAKPFRPVSLLELVRASLDAPEPPETILGESIRGC